MRLLLFGFIVFAILPMPTRAQRTVALTFDDLPLADGGVLVEAERVTVALLDAWRDTVAYKIFFTVGSLFQS